jgi:hypothetical protein
MIVAQSGLVILGFLLALAGELFGLDTELRLAPTAAFGASLVCGLVSAGRSWRALEPFPRRAYAMLVLAAAALAAALLPVIWPMAGVRPLTYILAVLPLALLTAAPLALAALLRVAPTPVFVDGLALTGAGLLLEDAAFYATVHRVRAAHWDLLIGPIEYVAVALVCFAVASALLWVYRRLGVARGAAFPSCAIAVALLARWMLW